MNNKDDNAGKLPDPEGPVGYGSPPRPRALKRGSPGIPREDRRAA